MLRANGWPTIAEVQSGARCLSGVANMAAAKANARRLAACWNSLREFTTEEIEAGEFVIRRTATGEIVKRI
jgi:hypothetical protein